MAYVFLEGSDVNGLVCILEDAKPVELGVRKLARVLAAVFNKNTTRLDSVELAATTTTVPKRK